VVSFSAFLIVFFLQCEQVPLGVVFLSWSVTTLPFQPHYLAIFSIKGQRLLSNRVTYPYTTTHTFLQRAKGSDFTSRWHMFTWRFYSKFDFIGPYDILLIAIVFVDSPFYHHGWGTSLWYMKWENFKKGGGTIIKCENLFFNGNKERVAVRLWNTFQLGLNQVLSLRCTGVNPLSVFEIQSGCIFIFEFLQTIRVVL